MTDQPERPDQAAVIDVMARGLFKEQCESADADERRNGREPPQKWADPWQSHGIRQRELLHAKASAALAALDAAGYALLSVEPSEHEIDRIENCYSDCVDLEDGPRAAAIKLRLAMLGAAHD